MGVLLAIALAMTVRTALFGIMPIDAVSFSVALGALILLVAVASYVPSRRATRLDPSDVLRS